MRTVTRRIAKLEDRFSPTEGEPQILFVACKAGWGLALDMHTCVDILRDCGYLPEGRIGLVSFLDIPAHRSAEELERFLREHGADLSGPGCLRVQRDEDDHQQTLQATPDAKREVVNRPNG